MKIVGTDWFSLDPEEIEKYYRTAGGVFFSPGVKNYSSGKRVTIHRSHLPIVGENSASVQSPESTIPEKEPPQDLRLFQQEAAQWIAQRGGSILALDLGGGKTRTSTACAELPVVVGTPVSVIDVWRAECERKGWTHLVCHDRDELKTALSASKYDCYILPYSRAEALAGYFTRFRMGTLLLDEAHMLVNKYVTWSQAFRGLPRDKTILLTATPMRNRLVSLWGLLDTACPGGYGTRNQFRAHYCGAHPSPYGGMVDTSPTHIEELARRLTETIYKRTRAQMQIPGPEHHRTVRETRVERKFPSLLEILQGIAAPTGAHLTILGEMRQHISIEKAKVLDLKEAISHGYRVVFWVWFKETARILAGRLKALGVPVDVLMGDAPTRKRSTILAEWGRVPRAIGDERALVASIAAASTGIALANARLAVFVDLDWAPLNVLQAEKRHDRFGNHWGQVDTWYEVVPGTIDEIMIRALIEKQYDSEVALGVDGTLDQMIELLQESEEPKSEQEIICAMASRMLKTENYEITR